VRRPLAGKYDLQRIAHEAMLQHGLLPDFSPDVLEETERIARATTAFAPAIRDLRHLLWASIDNDDSRDLDQLSVAQALADGTVKILVAISDVDELVRKDSAIDSHARINTTSVYTPAQIFPMLPEKLSTDLTSLGEGQERLALIIDMNVAPDGKVVADDIYRAKVLNHTKLAYNEVAAWLEEDGPAPAKLVAMNGLDEQLRLQDRVALVMRGERQAHGALRLETIEARPVYDGDRLVDMRSEPRNRAKDLIEDFMIAANAPPPWANVCRWNQMWVHLMVFWSRAGGPIPSDFPTSRYLSSSCSDRANTPSSFRARKAKDTSVYQCATTHIRQHRTGAFPT
jgi:ribonuclease R